MTAGSNAMAYTNQTARSPHGGMRTWTRRKA